MVMCSTWLWWVSVFERCLETAVSPEHSPQLITWDWCLEYNSNTLKCALAPTVQRAEFYLKSTYMSYIKAIHLWMVLHVPLLFEVQWVVTWDNVLITEVSGSFQSNPIILAAQRKGKE